MYKIFKYQILSKTVVFFMLLTAIKANAQADGEFNRLQYKELNTVFFEVFGPGYMSSLNYSRIIYSDDKLMIAPRIGLGGSFLANVKGWNIPAEIDFLLGKSNHFFEGGIGLSYHSYQTKVTNSNMGEFDNIGFNTLNLSLRLGYRFQPLKSGLFLNMAFIPVFSLGSSASIRNSENISIGNPFQPWMGLGVGYSFFKKKKS